MRAGFANGGLRSLVVGFKLANLFFQSRCLFLSVGLSQLLGLIVELPAQDSFAFDERRIHALPHVGAGFSKQIKQGAGALSFADFEGERIETFSRLLAVL